MCPPASTRTLSKKKYHFVTGRTVDAIFIRVGEIITTVLYRHGHPIQQTGHRLGMVAVPARDQLNRENKISLSVPITPENVVSRDGFSYPVPAYARSFSTLGLNPMLTHGIPPVFQDGVYLLTSIQSTSIGSTRS